ncbi:MAG: hypothetical protein ABIH34_07685 [Nanoarchaeota archaeon]
MFVKQQEGKVTFYAPKGKISALLPVFYNPLMRLNRDFSVLAVRAWGKKVQYADILASTGIRGMRLLKETTAVKRLVMNDRNPKFLPLVRKNLALNGLRGKAELASKDANVLLYASTGFDVIDIDPFGSPNAFLDAALSRMARKGLLFVTATDTANLAGVYPQTGLRKYWATPLHNHLMHEVGLRILIRRVQLIAADKDRAAMPLFSYFRDHYYRICFSIEKGKTKAEKMFKEISPLSYSVEKGLTADEKGEFGPAWVGQLHDAGFLAKMAKYAKEMPEDTQKFLALLQGEAKVGGLGFIDLHEESRQGRKAPMKVKDALAYYKKKGYPVSQSHLCQWGISLRRVSRQ